MPENIYCFALDLIEDAALIAEYENYHKTTVVWPEIVAGIKQCGIVKMDIYRVGNRLVMILETQPGQNLENVFAKMLTLPRQQEWALLMQRFQQKIPGAQPHEHWALMTQIFDLNN